MTQENSAAYLLGVQHCELGKSIHYNPYREERGSGQDFIDWNSGWQDTHDEILTLKA